jgi:mono/diheme cytochrome c family protein
MSFGASAQPNIEEGKTLFKAKCAQCHNKNMRDKLTGPALGGTEERWAEYDREDLYKWIRNSQALIQEGHPRAVQLYNEWNKVAMNSNTDLTDENIESLLAYISDQFNNAGAVVVVPGAATETGTKKQGGSALIWWLIGGLAILALILAQIMGTLKNVVNARETGGQAAPARFLDIIGSKTLLGIALFCLVVFLGYRTVNSAIEVGRQQGYAPEQPIKFSHATHAGLQKIDCQYCHDGARRSKHSVIPAANTCMNCHKAIKVGSKYGTGELTKIYASIGFNPMTDTYIEDYESLPEEEIEKIYTKWMASTYLDKNGLTAMDSKGESLVAEQWMDLKESLTSDLKKQIPGAIEWVRIHNLPDHVYFSHKQHVTAGEIACQQCHGKVEEMEVVAQHSPLSMGWCINCHRQTEVAGFKNGNEYYANTYTNYHDALEKGEMSKVTVEQIGGLECQKCHY